MDKKFVKSNYLRNFIKGSSVVWNKDFNRYTIEGDMVFVSINGIKGWTVKQDKNGNDYLQVFSTKTYENIEGAKEHFVANFFNKQFVVVRDMYGKLGFIFKNDKLLTASEAFSNFRLFNCPEDMVYNYKGGNQYFVEDLSWDFIAKVKEGKEINFYSEEQDASKKWGEPKVTLKQIFGKA